MCWTQLSLQSLSDCFVSPAYWKKFHFPQEYSSLRKASYRKSARSAVHLSSGLCAAYCPWWVPYATPNWVHRYQNPVATMRTFSKRSAPYRRFCIYGTPWWFSCELFNSLLGIVVQFFPNYRETLIFSTDTYPGRRRMPSWDWRSPNTSSSPSSPTAVYPRTPTVWSPQSSSSSSLSSIATTSKGRRISKMDLCLPNSPPSASSLFAASIFCSWVSYDNLLSWLIGNRYLGIDF